MNALGVVLSVAGTLTLLPALVLAAEVLASFLPRRRVLPRRGPRPTVAVLVPAHDEEAGIADCLAALLPQLAPGDRLLVIADNCRDGTARVAAAAGAQVVVREDPSRRGKGHALAFGVDALAASPPEVVIVVDADCRAEQGAVECLAVASAGSGCPVQADYAMEPPKDAGPRQRLAALAWTVRNQARALGLARLGLPCQLMGSGMAFPWTVIRRAPLDTAHLVEDVMVGLALARDGMAPKFCPEARVRSKFPATEEGLRSQRRRWEHGHLGLMAQAPSLLARAVRRRDPGLAVLAVDLCVPPLALLVSAACAVVIAGVASLPWGGGAGAALGIVALGLAAASVFAVWRRDARHAVALSDLARVPAYLLWKLPVYGSFLRARERRWIRTRRDGGPGT